MHLVHATLFKLHIAIGAVALLVFWLPILTRKGSPLHRKAGRVFVICMTTVAISAMAMSLMVLIDPIGVRVPERNLSFEDAARLADANRTFNLFLLMLGVLTFSSLRHGMLALKTKSNPAALRAPSHRALLITLGVLGIAVGFVGVQEGAVLLIVFAVLSVVGSFNSLRDTRIAAMDRKQRLKAHFGGLIGTGVAAYTAFFAFGGSRLLADILTGQWQVLAWITPAIIGTIAIRRVEKRQNQGVTA
ncbi:MAG: hypothetical protein AAAFM81_06875 [Pseudomonadota bacterium]